MLHDRLTHVSIRGDGDNVGLSDTNAMFGNEYRDYLRLRTEKVPFQNGKTIFSVISNAIPKQIFSLIGQKKEDYSVYSAYILSDLWGNESGQRAGIWGEFYLNFGDYGIILCFIVFSFLIIYTDKNLLRIEGDMRRKFISSYLYSLLIFSIIGSWATVGDDLGSYGICYLFFYFVCFKQQKESNKQIILN